MHSWRRSTACVWTSIKCKQTSAQPLKVIIYMEDTKLTSKPKPPRIQSIAEETFHTVVLL